MIERRSPNSDPVTDVKYVTVQYIWWPGAIESYGGRVVERLDMWSRGGTGSWSAESGRIGTDADDENALREASASIRIALLDLDFFFLFFFLSFFPYRPEEGKKDSWLLRFINGIDCADLKEIYQDGRQWGSTFALLVDRALFVQMNWEKIGFLKFLKKREKHSKWIDGRLHLRPTDLFKPARDLKGRETLLACKPN